jgi:hypothetical protein
MKRAISISLTFLMLTALLHLSVASHYCGGNIVSSKISLSGKLATCGMEATEKDLPQTGTWYYSHCCDNVLTSVGTSNNYFPSFSFVPESNQPHSQFFTIPATLNIYSFPLLKSVNSGVGPPGAPAPNSVDLSALCTFRI